MFHKDQQVKFNGTTYIYVGAFIGSEPRNRAARPKCIQVAMGRQFNSFKILGEVNETLDIVHLPGQPNKKFLVAPSQLKKIHTHNKQDNMLRRARMRRGLSVMPSSWQHRPLVMTEPVQITEPTSEAPMETTND